MKKYSEMNGNEKIAYRNTKYAFQYEVGGIENEVLDGYREEMPTYEELEELVYDATTSATYGDGHFSCRPTKEVTFAGEKFIREVIRHFLDTECQFELKHEESVEQSAEESKSAVVEEGDKVYWSVVRCKTNIKAQPFVLMMIKAKKQEARRGHHVRNQPRSFRQQGVHQGADAQLRHRLAEQGWYPEC